MESIQVLFEPDNPDLDIVFVHGLNPSGSEDHARSTWTHSNNGTSVFWPDALLQESLPSARIILFAYNSSVRANASNTPVHSHAETLLNRLKLRRQKDHEKHRRLIFIAHSMGGLLVKQALVEAGIHSSNYGCIRASTKGLVFFATPHGGGDLARLADVAANFTSAMTGSAKNSFLKTLKQNSLLNEISTDHFRPQLADYEVLTFIEAKKMDVYFEKKFIKFRIVPQITSMYIVDSVSAKLGAPREVPLRLNRNHSDICKFSGPGDDDYELVSGNLQSMARKVQGLEVMCTECRYHSEAQPLWHPPIPHVSLRHPPVPHVSRIPGAPPSYIGHTGRGRPPINSLPLCRPFVGREDLVKEILETWQNWEDPTPRRISLSGLGGVGKTQLSRSIIGQLDHRNPTIWLNAGSKSSLEEGLRGAAISLRHELLQSESVATQPSAAQDGGFFYTSNARIDYLVEVLKVWLRTAQSSEGSMPQILVILDDVDGLESSELSELAEIVIGDGIDVIFSTRDPMMADQTSYMDATNFDVPPLQEDQAREILDKLTKFKHRTFAETEFISYVAASLGYLPAALVSVSHYLTDHLASRNTYTMSSYFARWYSPTDRSQILQFRRMSSRYPHTIQASFEVSLRRLRRNTLAESSSLYLCCLNLLRLLSALKIARFAKFELESLCDLIGTFVQAQGTNNTTEPGEEHNGLLVSLRQLSEDASKVARCATELLHVSLLTAANGTEILVLNELVKACVMLRAQDGSAADRGSSDLGLGEAENLLLERAARHISEIWAPCLLDQIMPMRDPSPSSRPPRRPSAIEEQNSEQEDRESIRSIPIRLR